MKTTFKKNLSLELIAGFGLKHSPGQTYCRKDMKRYQALRRYLHANDNTKKNNNKM